MSVRNLTSGRLVRDLPTVSNRNIAQGAATRTTPTEWVRPSDWLAMPDVTGQQRFAGLHAIAPDGNFVALSAAGDYTVDWGDGTTTNHNSGAVAYKEYNYANISSAGESVLGYRQVLISVTPQAGQNLTEINLQHRHNQTGLTAYNPLWLDIVINGVNLTTITIGGFSLPALQRVVILDHAVTNMDSMFNGCFSLASVPLFNTANVTNMAYMFATCSSLTSVPLFDTANVTDMSGMFSGCYALASVPLFNTASVTLTGEMFSDCRSLTSVPLFNTASVTDMGLMFFNCRSLTSVPLFNTANVTGMSSMFNGCFSLASVPLFDTASVTDMSNMFTNCASLTGVPLFNTANVTNMNGMFSSCAALASVPLFNTASVTLMSGMFNGCFSLASVPLFNTASATGMSNLFNNCAALTSVPLLNTANATIMNGMFSNCRRLTSVPLLNTANVTNMSSMFSGCSCLTSVPAMNANAATTLGTVTDFNISRFDMTNLNASISFASNKLSKSELERIFLNLLRRTVSTTITISGNYGADTAVSKTNCGTTNGSTTVTQSNTSSLQVGMRVTGTGFDANLNVTFQDSGDTVTLNSHGLSDGTKVSFATITTTTGILTNTRYFVINATTNTFQLAATANGSAINLVTNGSGTMRRPAYITAITTNTSFTVSAPASSTGTSTLACRILDTFEAVARGWTVSG